MAYPDEDVLDWVAAKLGAQVKVVRGLRHGDSPWLLRAGDREVVLRIARAERAAETATEVAAMTCALRGAGATLPVAELLGYDLAEQTDYGLVLTACVLGTSTGTPRPEATDRSGGFRRHASRRGRLGPAARRRGGGGRDPAR